MGRLASLVSDYALLIRPTGESIVLVGLAAGVIRQDVQQKLFIPKATDGCDALSTMGFCNLNIIAIHST